MLSGGNLLSELIFILLAMNCRCEYTSAKTVPCSTRRAYPSSYSRSVWPHECPWPTSHLHLSCTPHRTASSYAAKGYPQFLASWQPWYCVAVCCPTSMRFCFTLNLDFFSMVFSTRILLFSQRKLFQPGHLTSIRFSFYKIWLFINFQPDATSWLYSSAKTKKSTAENLLSSWHVFIWSAHQISFLQLLRW